MSGQKRLARRFSPVVKPRTSSQLTHTVCVVVVVRHSTPLALARCHVISCHWLVFGWDTSILSIESCHDHFQPISSLRSDSNHARIQACRSWFVFFWWRTVDSMRRCGRGTVLLPICHANVGPGCPTAHERHCRADMT